MSNTNINPQDRADLIEFALDHINHFHAIPLEFETADGIVITYADIWDVCEEEGLTKMVMYK